jgi:hypothetical protein
MGIDGIGKGAGSGAIVPPTASKTGDTARVGSDTAPFRVERGAPVAPTTPATLDRVRSGDLSVSQYLDEKVTAVTSHLIGRITPDQLAFVQENLREQLSTDPVLVDLVKAATGAVPPDRKSVV